MQHLLSTADLSRADAVQILDTADEMARLTDRAIKKLPTLRGRTVVNLFFEDSTRTRTSFASGTGTSTSSRRSASRGGPYSWVRHARMVIGAVCESLAIWDRPLHAGSGRGPE